MMITNAKAAILERYAINGIEITHDTAKMNKREKERLKRCIFMSRRRDDWLEKLEEYSSLRRKKILNERINRKIIRIIEQTSD